MEMHMDPEDLVQVENPEPTAVHVSVAGPVDTRELPAVRSGFHTEQGVGAAVAVKLLPLEPRRKSALLLAVAQDIWLSGSQAGAQAGAAAAIRVPKGLPWPVASLEEIWACSTTDVTDISVQAEYLSE
ncbi:hypothetical protein E4K10_49890 [Streptomyces sp. T1317-0309]|nr:hypothetical protein E4K10_49890 [Streptomyces sp. T1317-0309]